MWQLLAVGGLAVVVLSLVPVLVPVRLRSSWTGWWMTVFVVLVVEWVEVNLLPLLVNVGYGHHVVKLSWGV